MTPKFIMPSQHRSRTLFLLRMAGSQVEDSINKYLKQHRLTSRQFSVLFFISESEQNIFYSQQELSEFLVVNRNAMVSLIDQLEKRLLVRRVRSTKDRRAYNMHITKQGTELLSKCIPTIISIGEAVTKGLSTKQKGELDEYLLAIIHAFSDL